MNDELLDLLSKNEDLQVLTGEDAEKYPANKLAKLLVEGGMDATHALQYAPFIEEKLDGVYGKTDFAQKPIYCESLYVRRQGKSEGMVLPGGNRFRLPG